MPSERLGLGLLQHAVQVRSGVIKACAGHVFGISDPLFLDVAYTGVSRFLAASTDERSVGSLYETAHLRPPTGNLQSARENSH